VTWAMSERLRAPMACAVMAKSFQSSVVEFLRMRQNAVHGLSHAP
jgi:hypothetical protein